MGSKCNVFDSPLQYHDQSEQYIPSYPWFAAAPNCTFSFGFPLSQPWSWQLFIVYVEININQLYTTKAKEITQKIVKTSTDIDRSFHRNIPAFPCGWSESYGYKQYSKSPKGGYVYIRMIWVQLWTWKGGESQRYRNPSIRTWECEMSKSILFQLARYSSSQMTASIS